MKNTITKEMIEERAKKDFDQTAFRHSNGTYYAVLDFPGLVRTHGPEYVHAYRKKKKAWWQFTDAFEYAPKTWEETDSITRRVHLAKAALELNSTEWLRATLEEHGFETQTKNSSLGSEKVSND